MKSIIPPPSNKPPTIAYLQNSLEYCSDDKRVEIAYKLARWEMLYRAFQAITSGAETWLTTAAIASTLAVLTVPGINYHSTKWFQSIEWLKVPPDAVQAVQDVAADVVEAVAPSNKTAFVIQGQTLDTARITSEFGAQESFRDGPHAGVDFGLPEGTPIVAPENGTIKRVFDQPDGGGKVVEFIPDSDKSLTVKFLHLSSQDVTEGQQVKAGDVIAKSGNTGRSTGPHLDVRVEKDGAWIDPMPYLQGLGKESSTKTASTPVIPEELKAPEVIEYLKEVALGAEFGNLAPEIVQWQQDEITYKVHGNPDASSTAKLSQVMNELTELTGKRFKAVDSGEAMAIHFIPVAEFQGIIPSTREDNIGYFQGQFSGNYITGATILISTDDEIETPMREHIIREEVTQALGMMKDSEGKGLLLEEKTYWYSIFFQGMTSKDYGYSDLDKKVIRLHSMLKPGMTAEDIDSLLN